VKGHGLDAVGAMDLLDHVGDLEVDAPGVDVVHDLRDRRLVGAEAVAAVDQGEVDGGVEQVDRPVEGGVPAAHDEHPLAGEGALLRHEVVGAATLPWGHVDVGGGQALGLEGAVTAGDDHRARAQLAAVGVQHHEVVLVGDALRRGLEVHRHVELLERLLTKLGDEVGGQDAGMARDVVDPLLRIKRRALPTDVGQRVDDPRRRVAHAGPEGRGQAHGAGPDDRDVANFVEVELQRLCHVVAGPKSGTWAERGVPSRALSARSTEQATQVRVGVSRLV
jgi:hypothetical protein